jgi:2-iminobutanoate/2-iminopropanoate deaminase
LVSIKRPVYPKGGPPPRGAYSPGLLLGDLVFVSGQSARDAELNVVGDTIEEQTALTLENVKGVLEEAGCSMADVLKATVHLKDLSDFGRYDQVYARYFPDPKPVRTTVGSALAPGVLVEIDVIACRGGREDQ